MASFKNIFGANIWKANIFGGGIWRGAATPRPAGIRFTTLHLNGVMGPRFTFVSKERLIDPGYRFDIWKKADSVLIWEKISPKLTWKNNDQTTVNVK